MEQSYFASANGYSGFTSLFDEVFDSRKFEKVFILKGGPGTGKSTFMKKMCQEMIKINANINRFLCSSDTNSLDGLIIELNNKKIAFIDGTSPHERDATFVGVIDELVNLGESIDSNLLSSSREKIIDVSKEKCRCYRTAYAHLMTAGECDKQIYRTMPKIDEKSALKYISKFTTIQDCSWLDQSLKIFNSSFGKNGYKTIEMKTDDKANQVNIGGDWRFAEMFLRYLDSQTNQMNKIVFLSPFDKNHIESIFINNYLFTINNIDFDIDASVFFDFPSTFKEETKTIKKVHNDMLLEAKKYFLMASELHFQLEDIYQKCMNFDNNNIIFDKIYKKVLKVYDCC